MGNFSNVIDEFDKVRVGNTNPHWTGGFNSTLSWKGLKLYTRFDFALGFWIYESGASQSTTPWHLGCMQGTYNVPDLYYFDTIEVSSIFDKQHRSFLYNTSFDENNSNMVLEPIDQQEQRTILNFSNCTLKRLSSYN